MKFQENLKGLLHDILKRQNIFLKGKINGHVGNVARVFDNVKERYGPRDECGR